MKMSSRDDETLPLSGFTEDLPTDVTVDEDFIPTSQPQSSLSSKVNKSDETSSLETSLDVNTQPLSAFVDDTLPPEALIHETQDKSTDFIPDTETKRRNINYFNKGVCKKKLPIFGMEDIFASPLEKLNVPENITLDLQTNSALGDSIMKMDFPNVKMAEDPITEILVNDSGETVELGDTPVNISTLEGVPKSETCQSFGSDRYEETQIFDNSVLLDQAGPSGLNKVTSQKLYLNETIDDELQLESKSNVKLSRNKKQIVEIKKQNGDFLKEEDPLNTTSQNPDSDSPVIVRRIVDLKLTVSCLLTINATTKNIVQKAILKVNEKPKPKASLASNEAYIEYTSDKSKTYSSSSSGSVYSEKNRLSFSLPQKVSAMYDQPSTSDSSEESLAKLFINERRHRERIPWISEYLLPLKMDEIIKGMIDNEDLVNRPIVQTPKKSKSLHPNDLNHLDHISENSSSDQALKSETDESHPEKVVEGENLDATEDNPTPLPEEGESREEAVERNTENDSNNVVENVEPENDQEKQINPEPEKPQEADVRLCDGLRVFARWTDKQYYSGVLTGQSKNDKWDVSFDDGTLKAIKEDFIMPVKWLKVGSLVFALVDDSYESGQVVDLKMGEKLSYVVQLDSRNREVTVELSDMTLSDDMASILRENYRRRGLESPQRKADINCDNVVTGKRHREYRTPLRPPQRTRIETPGSRKKPTSKRKDSETIKGTPRKKKNDQKNGLKTVNGHLVEDKIASEESPSFNETGETPFRGNAKEARGKARPRSLTYESEERQKKGKQTSWLAADGTPIPGPSGVKFRKKKTFEPATSVQLECSLDTTELEGSQQTERSRRKRKAAETKKEESPKKSVTETETRMTRGKRK